jgi:hypothetical protein
MKFGAAFGIGFGAGFVGTFTGGAALTSVGASGISGGILAGIVSGAGGAAASSPIAGLGNYAVFGDQYSAGDFVRDVVFGSVLGGVTSGVVTRITCPGCNIWTGRPQLSPTLPQTARVEIPERTYAPDLKTESALPAAAPSTSQISGNTIIPPSASSNVSSSQSQSLKLPRFLKVHKSGFWGSDNAFGKEISKATTRIGREGKAVEVFFKDGSKIDITAARVKAWVPNTHPKAPAGTFQKVKFENFIIGSKGYKRLPTQYEIEFLNKLFK